MPSRQTRPTASGDAVGPADATALAAAGHPVQLTFQAVRCDDWSSVPGNVTVSPLLDDTGGSYVGWGPAVDGVVATYQAADLPPGCTFADGISLRATSSEHGNTLVPIADIHQPPGAEDGSTTTRLGETGTAGPGQLVVASAELTPPQQVALADDGPGDGGLWVAADLASQPDWRFANLRCHRDTYNADNREVVRPGPVEDAAACVLFAVGAASPTAVPLVAPAAPQVAPVPAPAPTTTPAPVPEAAPGPPPPPDGVVQPMPPESALSPGPGGGDPSAPLDPTPAPSGGDPANPLPALPGLGPLTSIVPPGSAAGGATAPPGTPGSTAILPDGTGSLDPLRPPGSAGVPVPGGVPYPACPACPVCRGRSAPPPLPAWCRPRWRCWWRSAA